MYKAIAACALLMSACSTAPNVELQRRQIASLERPGRDGTWYPSLRDRQQNNAVQINPYAEPAIAGLELLTDERSLLSKRSIYYANNSYTIEGAYHDVIEAHAQFLRELTLPWFRVHQIACKFLMNGGRYGQEGVGCESAVHR